ncbi:MAG: hypothetical protein EXQ47_07490 [Bryobacterales bacterium]|nr:hypothetical protein [Bryobacterales bacterium]
MRNAVALLFALVFLTSTALYGQPTNGPVYWSTVQPDCSALNQTAVLIRNDAGTPVGYSCYITGTFIWFAAGGDWNSYIRVAAPGFGAIGADYTFYDNNGNNLSLDTTRGAASARSSGRQVKFALAAHQPSELRLLGTTSAAPNYASTATGTVYAVFYCPNSVTCETLKPQLFYSALPRFSWTMAAPIAWDKDSWTQWSGAGVDDGGSQRVSFVVYNQGSVATSYRIRVFDRNGSLAGSGVTPQIPGFQVLPDGSAGEAGTYGALLSQVITTPLPAGIFKILIDGGAEPSSVEILQFTGASATTLEAGYDTAIGLPAIAAVTQQTSGGAQPVRRVPTPKGIFQPLPQD